MRAGVGSTCRATEPPRIPACRRGRRRGGAARRRARRARPLGGRALLRRRRALRQREPAALHRLPRAAPADPLPRAERQPRPRRRTRAAAAPRRRSAAQALRHRIRHARSARVHLPRLRARGATRTGRWAASRTSRRWSRKLKASRPGALLLDGGDTWQGSGTALWTKGQDMIDAQKLLGVDVMTGHWEFTLGADRVKAVVEGDFAGRIDFVAQNVKTADFGDPVFPPYVIRTINGVPVAIVGQAFPYTPIANPRYFVAEWTFGIQDDNLQKVVDEVARQGCAGRRAAVAQRHGRRPEARLPRVRHRRDPGRAHARRRAAADGRRQRAAARRSSPTPAATASSSRCSTSTSSHGSIADFRYRLLPVFSRAAPGRPGHECADREGPRAVCRETRREARGHRRPPLPSRQFQRDRRPADPRRR